MAQFQLFPSRIAFVVATATLAPDFGCDEASSSRASDELDAASTEPERDASTEDASTEDAANERVATSGRVLVLSSTDTQGKAGFTVLDLEIQGTFDLLSPALSDMARAPFGGPRTLTATKQGTTLASIQGAPSFAQLEDDGFEPLAPVLADPGSFAFAGFVADGRYALYTTSEPLGFVLFDTRSREAVWQVEYAAEEPPAATVQVDAVLGPHGAFAVQLGARTLAVHVTGTVEIRELPAGAGLPVFHPDDARIAYEVHDPERLHSKLEWMSLADGARHPLGADLPFAVPRFFLPGEGGVVVSISRPAGPPTWDLRKFGLDGDLTGTALHDAAGPGVTAWLGAEDRRSLLVEFEVQAGMVELRSLDPYAARAPTLLGRYAHVSEPQPLGTSGFSFFSDPSTLDALFTVHAVVPDAQGSLMVSVVDTNLRGATSCTHNFARVGSDASYVLGTIYEGTVPDDLYVYGNGLGTQLFVADIAHGAPARVATLGDGSAALSCPVWSPNAQAFAFSTWTQTGSKVYVVRRNASGLGAPELVYQSDANVRVIAARL